MHAKVTKRAIAQQEAIWTIDATSVPTQVEGVQTVQKLFQMLSSLLLTEEKRERPEGRTIFINYEKNVLLKI